ncbi:MAG TPA: LuxR C-terminal-related transcriptional regulator [Ktedonobacteraceae bacterium]|nr:LuxR C-terminal-related transcriptional regulator [Ktedonobacteraceae bacterium]
MQTADAIQHTDHENLIQGLSAMMLQINALQKLVRNDAEASSPQNVLDRNAMCNGLIVLEQITREMFYELSITGNTLQLTELPGASLAEALSSRVEEMAESLGLSSRVSVSGEEHPLSSEAERLLYRIGQEALYQVQQHIGARKLRFMLTYGRDDVLMSIEDDGVPTESSAPALSNTDEIPAPPFTPTSEQPTLGAQLKMPILDALRIRIEHLGGSLEIHSGLEQGTQVQVRVPYVHHVHPEAAVPTSQSLSSVTASQQTRVRVLVVDGQSVTRAGLHRLLEGYPDLEVVGEAADGVQAVSEAVELGPQVVLMDTQLPNNSSLEALRQIKQLNTETRVLFLSTLDREEVLYESLRAGADGYVLKDIAPDELAQAIRTVARGELLIQPQIAGRMISRLGQQARGNAPHEALTTREQEVLRLLARGLRNKEIAARLYVSERTVNFHLANIYQKLNVSGRTEALSKAHERGLLTA